MSHIFRRLSETEIEKDHYPQIRSSGTSYIRAAIDQSSQTSRGLGIVLATSITVVLVAVVFVTLSVLPGRTITTRCRTGA
jgi:hypothetical protein